MKTIKSLAVDLVFLVAGAILYFALCNMLCAADDYLINDVAEFAINDPVTAPTPQAEVDRILAVLPVPKVGFVDFGCGPEARYCISAARKWKIKTTGIEIDPASARLARARVASAGLSDLVTIVEGDATTTDVQADVGVAYLYHDTLEKLTPRVKKLKAFASYLHEPPNLHATQDGNFWIYIQPPPKSVVPAPKGAVWNGMLYTGPLCTNPYCEMCNSIRAQLAQQQAAQAAQTSDTKPATAADEQVIQTRTSPAAPKGHYETRTQKVKVCTGRRCYFVDQPVQVWVPDQ